MRLVSPNLEPSPTSEVGAIGGGLMFCLLEGPIRVKLNLAINQVHGSFTTLKGWLTSTVSEQIKPDQKLLSRINSIGRLDVGRSAGVSDRPFGWVTGRNNSL